MDESKAFMFVLWTIQRFPEAKLFVPDNWIALGSSDPCTFVIRNPQSLPTVLQQLSAVCLLMLIFHWSSSLWTSSKKKTTTKNSGPTFNHLNHFILRKKTAAFEKKKKKWHCTIAHIFLTLLRRPWDKRNKGIQNDRCTDSLYAAAH